MLTYVFEHNGKPLYEQVYDNIKEDIVAGRLRPGEKLPSKRSFAGNNGISTITIQNAYDQLIGEGYIYSIPKKGYYVSDILEMNRIPRESWVSYDIEIPKDRESYDVDLSSNAVNPDTFPFSIWARMSRETISSQKKELMEVSPTGGIRALRSAIADYLRSFRGMLVDPDQIVIGAGTEYLYSLLIQLIGSDREYCIENPGYKILANIYRQHRIDCKYIPMDEHGIRIPELHRSGADIVHISPNHHFPSGITMPASRRYEVLAWANEKPGRYIIEDDYDSEFRPNGKPLPTLFSIDACERVIYMNTFSKSLTPTIRISYMILPVHLANRFYSQLSFYACTVSTFEQYTLAAFIRNGYFEKHINRMRLYYSRQRKRLIESIEKSPIREHCRIIENQSGLHFRIRLDTQLSDEEVSRALAEKGIKIQAISEYYLTDEKPDAHDFIINYSDVDVKAMPAVWETMNLILDGENK